METGGAEPLAVELALPGGRKAGARIEWDRGALLALSSADGTEAAESPWELRGEIAWDEVSALRVISAAFGEGSLLVLASLRPKASSGHDLEAVHGLAVHGADVEPLGEVLLSTEYDAAGLPRRIVAEIRTGAAPLRLAGDRAGEVRETGERITHEAVPMTFRLAGEEGRGLHERLLGK